MTIRIIDYGSGNLHSALKAFQKAGEPLGLSAELTADPHALASASHVVLPGVGAFGDCVAGLKAADGMIEALEDAVLKQGKPFFGICVGMQMMLERGLEHGEHAGLGWIEGAVTPLIPNPQSPLPIPHMGWNTLTPTRQDHPLFRGLAPDAHVYFVHSFHAQCANAAELLATTDYGGSICAAIGRDNLVGTQFHPEKSGAVGLQLIANFLQMR